MKRYTWALLVLPLVTGCFFKIPTDPKKAEPAPPATTSVAPAPASGTGNVVMPGGPGGGVVTGDIGSLAAPNRPVSGATATPNSAPVATDPKQSFGTQAGKLIDMEEARKNPKIIVASTKITGQDPLTASTQAYFSVPARAQMANFQNQYRIMKEINDGKPLNFDQFMQLVRDLKIEFMHLPPWQMLGYDMKSGEIVLLEDKGEKIKRYKERGIPIDDADKQYDTP